MAAVQPLAPSAVRRAILDAFAAAWPDSVAPYPPELLTAGAKIEHGAWAVGASSAALQIQDQRLNAPAQQQTVDVRAVRYTPMSTDRGADYNAAVDLATEAAQRIGALAPSLRVAEASWRVSLSDDDRYLQITIDARVTTRLPALTP